MSFIGDPAAIADKKAALRKSIRAARRALTPQQRAAAAHEVKLGLLDLFEKKGISGGTVLAYMPMRYELDITPAAAALKARGFEVAYPLCTEGHGLKLLIPAEENGFAVGAYGILEPREEASREVSPGELAAIILPAVGFDRSFNRLGQGGGYYDRLLAVTDCFTVAVGFDCQLVKSVPTEPNDRDVDAIVVPGLTHFKYR